MNNFIVEIDLHAPEPTPDQVDALMDILPDEYESAWGMSHGLLQAQLTIPSKTIRQAVDLALLVVSDAAQRAGFGAPQIASLTVSTEAEFERRQSEHEIPDLLSTEEVAEQLGISRQAVVKRAEKLGGRKVGDRAWVFDAATIEKFTSKNG